MNQPLVLEYAGASKRSKLWIATAIMTGVALPVISFGLIILTYGLSGILAVGWTMALIGCFVLAAGLKQFVSSQGRRTTVSLVGCGLIWCINGPMLGIVIVGDEWHYTTLFEVVAILTPVICLAATSILFIVCRVLEKRRGKLSV